MVERFRKVCAGEWRVVFERAAARSRATAATPTSSGSALKMWNDRPGELALWSPGPDGYPMVAVSAITWPKKANAIYVLAGGTGRLLEQVPGGFAPHIVDGDSDGLPDLGYRVPEQSDSRRQWVRLGWVLGGAGALALLLAGIWLLLDWRTKPPGEYYAWNGWHFALLFGSYFAGLALGLAWAGRKVWQRLRRPGNCPPGSFARCAT